MMNLELGEAIGIGIQTLVGVDTSEYPTRGGNCFSVRVKDHPDSGVGEAGNRLDIGETRIVNFGVENLIRLLEIGVVEWPVRIAFLNQNKRVGIIHDHRIPTEWYDKRYCEVCCPDHLLPLPQQAVHDIEERAGHWVTTGPLLKLSHGDKSKEAARVRALANGEEWDPDEWDRRRYASLSPAEYTVRLTNEISEDQKAKIEMAVADAMAKLVADKFDDSVRDWFLGDSKDQEPLTVAKLEVMVRRVQDDADLRDDRTRIGWYPVFKPIDFSPEST